jgi:hypothetical protein
MRVSGRIINGPELVADVHEIMAQDFRRIRGPGPSGGCGDNLRDRFGVMEIDRN